MPLGSAPECGEPITVAQRLMDGQPHMTRPVLPNSPLGEVVFEIRFPGDLGLYSIWGEIQQKLGQDFPTLWVPHISHGEAAALKPYRLATNDQSEMVTLSLNSFAFVSKRYKNYEGFRSRFERVLTVLRSCFTPRTVTRTGLRYINWLPREFDNGAAVGQLHPALKLAITGMPGLDHNLEDAQCLFVVPVGDHKLRVALVPEQPVTAQPVSLQAPAFSSAVLLDFDCYREGDTRLDDVLGVLDSAHRVIDDAFFSMVTPTYLQYLRGER